MQARFRISAAAVALGVATLIAAHPSPAPAQTSGGFHVDTPRARLNLAFGEREIATIRTYYAPAAPSDEGRPARGKKKGLPPGLQKKVERGGELPPGLQKRIDRGESLPPGLAKRALPADLERRLAKLPPGYARYLVGDDVVLLDTRRNVVLDVVANVGFSTR